MTIGSESKKILDSHCAVYPENLVTYFVKGASNVGDLVCLEDSRTRLKGSAPGCYFDDIGL